MSHLEAVGKLYVENRRLSEEYAKLLTLLAKFRDGEYRPEQITIDLDKQTWALTLGAADLTPPQPAE